MESWMRQQGALIGSSRTRPEAFHAAIDQVLVTLGYAPDEADDLVLYRYGGDRSACVTGTMEAGLARALARSLARHAASPISLLHATAVFRDGAKPACTFDAFEATYDATGGARAPRPSVVDEIDYDAEELDTDKPWRLVEWALDTAIAAWGTGGGASIGRTGYRAPPSTGVARLDTLLWQVRFGAHAEIGTFEGRACVRVRGEDGATITTFVTPEELARVVELAPMLRA